MKNHLKWTLENYDGTFTWDSLGNPFPGNDIPLSYKISHTPNCLIITVNQDEIEKSYFSRRPGHGLNRGPEFQKKTGGGDGFL